MELFRFGHDAWGRIVLEGVSWDLLPVAAGVGLVVIIGHAIYRMTRRKSGG